MKTYEQIIDIIKEEIDKTPEEEYDQGYNDGLNYSIRILNQLLKEQKVFLDDLQRAGLG